METTTATTFSFTSYSPDMEDEARWERYLDAICDCLTAAGATSEQLDEMMEHQAEWCDRLGFPDDFAETCAASLGTCANAVFAGFTY